MCHNVRMGSREFQLQACEAVKGRKFGEGPASKSNSGKVAGILRVALGIWLVAGEPFGVRISFSKNAWERVVAAALRRSLWLISAGP